MSKFFLIGDNVNIDDDCKGLEPFVRIIKKALLPMFYIIIPIALILFGVIDLGKAVIASDEKEIKEAQSKLNKRFIYAALVFLIVFLVSLLMNVVAASNVGDTNIWWDCWDNV